MNIARSDRFQLVQLPLWALWQSTIVLYSIMETGSQIGESETLRTKDDVECFS